jgi:hypothetical protein
MEQFIREILTVLKTSTKCIWGDSQVIDFSVSLLGGTGVGFLLVFIRMYLYYSILKVSLNVQRLH